MNVGQEANLTFRAVSVNFLNTPQFAEPSGRHTDSNFNAITNTLNEGRTIRFAVEADSELHHSGLPLCFRFSIRTLRLQLRRCACTRPGY
ncbi:MAG: hypothetical protein R2748_14390 [Bryobacterales bacterium]